MKENSGIYESISECVDFLLFGVAYYISLNWYQNTHFVSGHIWPDYFILFLVYILCWFFCSDIFKVYQSRRFMNFIRETIQIIKANFLSFAITLITVSFFAIYNRFIFYFEALALFLVILVHVLIRCMLHIWRSLGKNARYLLILGGGPSAMFYLDIVQQNPQLGYRVIGYLSPVNSGLSIHYLGDYALLKSVINTNIVDQVVITSPLSDEGVRESLELLDIMGKTTTILLDDMISKVACSRQVDFNGLPMVVYDGHPRRPWQEIIKRLLDIVLSGFSLIILSPILAVIAILIKLNSKGPVIFAQERVGINGRTFKMYKFRSMVVNAEELKDKLAHLNEMSGPVFKIKNDPRVTPIGKFLRMTSLDELPQFWNVLIGDMSLVGPRPPLPKEVKMYDPKHRKRLAVKPGITCIWQISGRNQVDFEEWMEMDVEYVERWSLWLDMAILAKTVQVVIMKKGAS